MTSEIRTRTMRAVKSKNTKPELLVRKIVYALGYRYRLHRRDLPGCPDLVFSGRKKVVFVHGCFWHGHNCKRGARAPKENKDYWLPKLANNVKRDIKNQKELKAAGWKILTIWECEIKDLQKLKQVISRFLDT